MGHLKTGQQKIEHLKKKGTKILGTMKIRHLRIWSTHTVVLVLFEII